MILYINSSETDYGQDIFYSGLVQKFGRSEVFDWPFNINYYFSRRPYPRNLGNCGLNGIISSQSVNRIKSNFSKKFWDDVKVVIVAACKGNCFRSYLEIIEQIPSHVPVVFNDGGDFVDVAGHLKASNDYELYLKAISIRPFDMILKREYVQTETYAKNVIPFSFGFNFDVLPNSLKNENSDLEKKYQVSFWAVESHPIRTKALTLIQDKWDCRSNGTEPKQKFKKYKRKGAFYLEELKRCQVVLNFRGVGWDTLRYWEVPAIGGFMVTEKPGIEIPNNFIDGQHVRFCKEDLSDLVEICDWSLSNPNEVKKMALAAQIHAKKYHSSIARADYFFEKLEQITGKNLIRV